VATTDRGTSVVVSGTDFTAVRRLDDWWQVPAWPTGAQEALIGQRAANFIADEHDLKLTFADKPITLHGSGRVKTGGDEDSRIYMPLPAFTAWTGTGVSVIEVQVPGGGPKVEAAITQLHQALPDAHVEPVRQLVEGESRIVDRTHALMYAAVLLIALTVAVSVLATLSASVLERRRDFALMKALGGTQLQLMLLFLLEALVLALAGVVAGYVVGSAAALGISEMNFHTATLPRLSVVPLVLLLNVLIAALAALFPARVLRGLQPAALLKGE
jgi:putative ABC transport system permease protein